MEFSHAFWAKPLKENKFNENFELSLQTTLLDFALSVAFIHKFNNKITLYADKEGSELLSFIDYDKVVILDVPEDLPKHFAASVKFIALKKMQLNEILIDGDILLRKPDIYDIIRNKKDDVIYSVFEENTGILAQEEYVKYYTKLMDKLKDADFEEPYHNFTLEDIVFPNTSILKFNSELAKGEYIKQYEKHIELLKSIDFEGLWPDLIIEQYFLKLCCDYHNFSNSPILYDFIHNEEKALEIGFSHLGPMKYKYNTMARMELYFADKKLFDGVLKKYKEITGKIM